MKRAYAFLTILLLAACAALQPATFNQKLLVGYETVAGVRAQTINLLVGKKITPEDAQNIQNQADEARKGLDIARTLHDQGNLSADAKLDASRTALVALQTYLTSQATK